MIIMLRTRRSAPIHVDLGVEIGDHIIKVHTLQCNRTVSDSEKP